MTTRWIMTAALAVVVALIATLAVPVRTWRTGDQGLERLTYAPSPPPTSRRLWIDTDAACGHDARTDPDDCLALALLVRSAAFEIAGISTVAGNAGLDVVERTTRELAASLDRTLPVYRGGAQARAALIAALEQGPLSFVGLGPLGNLAAVLGERPDLQPRLERVVAVMGRRPGHIFHPAEGADRGAFFGHGPVFRDFNFEMDRRAAAQVVALNVPLTLVPYDAARRVEIGAVDLDRMSAAGGAAAWIAERARPWLAYWRKTIGREGFCPFDLVAAAYVVNPALFRCAPVDAWVGDDATLFWRPTALLVEQNDGHARALYCAQVEAGIKPWLIAQLSR